MTYRIDAATLRLGPELDHGGRGRILPVLGRTGPDGSPLVVKSYHPEWAAQLNADALDRLGDVLADAGEAAWLQARTAWPQALVENQGRVEGFLMRAVPGDFGVAFDSGPGAPSSPKLSRYTFLLDPDHDVHGSGLRVTDRDRLLLLADVADALRRLHGLGITVGDLSPKNLLFALRPEHRTFFVGCDAMRLGGMDALPQTHTPDWELPPGEPPGTVAADLYKFGLLVIRLFARDQASQSAAALAEVSPLLGEMAVLSRDGGPAFRPSPEHWIPVLREVAQNLPNDAPPMDAPPMDAPPAFAPPTFAPSAFAAPHGMMAGAPAPATAPPPGGMGGMGAMGLGAAGPWTGTPPRARPRIPAWGLAAGAGVLLLAGGVGIVHLTQSSGTLGATQQSNYNGYQGQPESTTTDPAAAYPTVPDFPAATDTATTDDPGIADTTDTPDGGATTDSPTDTATTDPASALSVGLVQIDPSIAADPRANQVATMFNDYFTAITAKDYSTALSLYDPAGVINPADPAQVRSFEKAEATSSASNVNLLEVDPSGSSGPVTTAHVTFQSNQDSGYGPGDNTSETCTMWDLTYTLTYTSDGGYLINQSKGSDAPC